MRVQGRDMEVDQVAIILTKFFDNRRGFTAWMERVNPYGLAIPLAEWVIEHISLPSRREQNDAEFYLMALEDAIKPKHLENTPKYKSHQSDEVGKIVVLLLELLKYPVDQVFKIGRFKVRTKGNPDMTQVLKCLDKVSKIPFFNDFKKVLYGDILISEEDDIRHDRVMEDARWVAYYDDREDIIRIRTAHAQLCNKKLIRTIIHELAHRYWRKTMSVVQKEAWTKYDEQLRQQGGVLELNVGDKLNNLFLLVDDNRSYQMAHFPSDRTVKLKVSEIAGDYFYATIDYENYQPIDPFIDMHLKMITRIDTRAFGPFKVSEYGRVEDGHFPSMYAQANKEEHFCEAIAFYYLGDLGEEATMELKKALNRSHTPGRQRKVIASSQASWSILSQGVSSARVEAHIVRTHMNQMVEAIKENSQLADEIYKRCGDNFEALPRHLSKLERSLDRTNYALISMGSEWYRQRLTHEDREMVDMASKYNPTPFPSTSKQSEFEMRKNAGFGRLIGNAIEDFREELEKLDPEYIWGGDSWIAESKEEALHSGDFDHAMSLTKDRRVKEVIMAIRDQVENFGRTRRASAKRVAKTKFEVSEFIEDKLFDIGFSEVKVLSVKEDREDKNSLYALVHCEDNNKWATIYQDDEGYQQIDKALLDERRTRSSFDRETTGRELARRASAKRVAKMRFEDFLLDHIDELIKLDREFGDDSSDKSEALWGGDFDHAIKLTRNQRAKDYIQFLDNKFLVWSEGLF